MEGHLAFADDVVLFCRANKKSFKAIREIEFKDFSGLEINKSKSAVLFSKSVANGEGLSRLLVFPVKILPMSHLGVPVTGRLVQHRNRQKLISIRSLTYTFVRGSGSQKEISWAQMTKSEGDGGIGIADYGQLPTVACTSRTARLWNGNSIWTRWIERLYVKMRALGEIQRRQPDSPLWKSVLKEKENIGKCIDCSRGGAVTWRGKGSDLSFGNIRRTLAARGVKDPMAAAI